MSQANMDSVNVQSQNFIDTVTGFLSHTYLWMMIGVLTTAITSLTILQSDALISFFFNGTVFISLILGHLFYGFYLSSKMISMSATGARVSFLIYSSAMGMILSVLLARYEPALITSVFTVTSLTFGGVCAYGLFTRRDLSGLGTFCLMGVIGLIVTSIASMVFPGLFSAKASFMMDVVAVLIFAGLAAYKGQAIKELAFENASGPLQGKIDPVIGAFSLYITFINLFLSVLRIMGRRR